MNNLKKKNKQKSKYPKQKNTEKDNLNENWKSTNNHKKKLIQKKMSNKTDKSREDSLTQLNKAIKAQKLLSRIIKN